MPQLPVPPAQRDLAEAAGAGDLDRLAELAVQAPAMVDAALPSQLTPLRIAAELQQLAAVEWLAAHGATLDIVTAWRLGWRDRAAQILAERPELANLRSGPWQLTPLHVAVWEHDRALVELLLSADPDLAIRDAAFSSTPLGWAEHFQRHALVSLIRAHQDRAGQV
jgi:Ankyrin repeat